jgi:hypothetical protein
VDNRHSPVVYRGGNKPVPVQMQPRQGEKNIPRLNFPGIIFQPGNEGIGAFFAGEKSAAIFYNTRFQGHIFVKEFRQQTFHAAIVAEKIVSINRLSWQQIRYMIL